MEKDSLARTHRHHRPRLAVRRQRPDPRRRNGQLAAMPNASADGFLEGSGAPEKVFNELWNPSRGRLGAWRGRKVLDDHNAVDLSPQD
jgi:hypothetical protein